MKLDVKAVLAVGIVCVAVLAGVTLLGFTVVAFILNVGWVPALCVAGTIAFICLLMWAVAYLENKNKKYW